MVQIINKMRILLSFVGYRDPYAEDNTEGPLLTCVKKLEPSKVYILRTNLEESARKTAEIISSMSGGIECEIIDTKIQDPTNYTEILQKLKVDVERICKEHTNGEFHINISSGTPQIEACWLLLVNSRCIQARLHTVKAPRFVRGGEERVSELDIQFIREEVEFDNAIQLISSHRYDGASKIFGNLAKTTYHLDKEKLYEILSKFSCCYFLWDLLDYGEAQKICIELVERFEKFKKVKSIFEKHYNILWRQEQILSSLVELQKENQETKEILLDIYHNSVRRYEESNYVDCLARFWRLYEGCLFYQLREKHGIDPRNIQEQNQDVKDKVHKILGKLPKTLSVETSMKVLEQQGDHLATRLLKEKKLKDLRSIRNDSISAHGLRMVSERIGSDCVRTGRWLLKETFRIADSELDLYPFQKKFVVDLFQEFRKAV
jgi:hypothetical protein